jgi:drug/metabolite transporter (DMT)-like permease
LAVFAPRTAVRVFGAGQTSLGAIVGPAAPMALAYVFLGETVGGWQMAGTALVLSGVYVLSRPSTAPAPTGSASKEIP